MAKKRPTKKKPVKGQKTPAGKSSSQARQPSQRQLDKLDREILDLINRRAELAIGRAERTDYGAIQNDAAVLTRLAESNRGPLNPESVRAVFREILSGTRSLEHLPRVAFLGPEYTYSHLAAIEHFGQSADLAPVGSIASVFEEVERGHAEFGIVPIDNSTDGRVIDTLQCLANSKVKMCAEVPLPIRNCLLGSGSRKDIQHVYSKPQALSQCRNWLGKHLPDAQLHEVASTAKAARKAAAEPSIGAIASRQAAVNHSLTVLASNIQDNPDNVTRFTVIGQNISKRTGNDKTSIVFEVDHRPGALADAMGIFKRNRLNLTWIESFPLPGIGGRYLFFIEFQGHSAELRPKRALASLEKKALRLDVLGSYAQAGPIG